MVGKRQSCRGWDICWIDLFTTAAKTRSQSLRRNRWRLDSGELQWAGWSCRRVATELCTGKDLGGGGSAGGICLDCKLTANVVEPRKRDRACEFMIVDLFRSGSQHAEIICWAYERHVGLFDTVIVMVLAEDSSNLRENPTKTARSCGTSGNWILRDSAWGYVQFASVQLGAGETSTRRARVVPEQRMDRISGRSGRDWASSVRRSASRWISSSRQGSGSRESS